MPTLLTEPSKQYVVKRDVSAVEAGREILLFRKNERVWGEPEFIDGRRFIKVQGELMPAEWFTKL